MTAWTCAGFEAALSDFREGRLPPEAAALARVHLHDCPRCMRLLEQVGHCMEEMAALPDVPLPAGFEQAVFARTLSPRARGRGWRGWWPGPMAGRLPRLAVGMAMAVFAAGMVLSAAQVNLQRLPWRQWNAGDMAGAIEAGCDRMLARGVSFYDDLRVVYEIQAALHQSKPQPPPSADGGRSLRGSPGAAGRVNAVALAGAGAGLRRWAGGVDLRRPQPAVRHVRA